MKRCDSGVHHCETRASNLTQLLTRLASSSAVLTLGAALLGAAPLNAADYRKSGDDHFYNLEYNQAIADYSGLIKQNPADPIPYTDLASAQLYKEMYRLGLLESGAFGKDNRFLHDQRPKADPGAKAQFLDTLERGRHIAEAQLSHDSRNAMAFYALCTDYALLATYEFMVERAWYAALRSGTKSRGYCIQAQSLDPQFVDSYLVLGVYEYAMGSLPLPVKMFAAIAGARGNKQKGIDYVRRVAEEGRYNRDAARVLLAVLYRREKHPLQAARVLQELMADYPRNYVFGLELALMYSDAGQSYSAVRVLKTLLQQADENAAGDQRFPRNAVEQEMRVLETRASQRQPNT